MFVAESKARFVFLMAALSALVVSGLPAHASPVLFTNAGAGTVAITTGVNVTELEASNDSVTAPSKTDAAFAFSSGIDFKSTGPATFTGVVDFSDPASKATGGSCPADTGGTCMVNTESKISDTTITGVTGDFASAAAAAVNQWNALTNTTYGWGSVSGTAANLDDGGTLCAGTGQTGCTYTATTTSTITVQGISQTAYVFNITSSGSHINGAVTIKGNGSTLVVLNYGGTQTLQTNQDFTLGGGLTSDQVLLNVTSSGGMESSGGFEFTGALAIRGSTEDLDSAIIHGRLFLDGTGKALIQSNFALTAPADVPAGSLVPEPDTLVFFGSGMLLIALGAYRTRSR